MKFTVTFLTIQVTVVPPGRPAWCSAPAWWSHLGCGGPSPGNRSSRPDTCLSGGGNKKVWLRGRRTEHHPPIPKQSKNEQFYVGGGLSWTLLDRESWERWERGVVAAAVGRGPLTTLLVPGEKFLGENNFRGWGGPTEMKATRALYINCIVNQTSTLALTLKEKNRPAVEWSGKIPECFPAPSSSLDAHFDFRTFIAEGL